jgi:hypothetical protein
LALSVALVPRLVLLGIPLAAEHALEPAAEATLRHGLV